MVYRVCVEKKPGLAPECASLLSDCRSFLDLKSLENVRIWNRYDVEGIDETLFAYATNTVFSEPQLDLTSGEIDASGAAAVFAVEPLPGQFDQRADSAAQCIQLLSQVERPRIRTAKVYALYGTLSEKDVEAVKHHVINPVESREASLAKPETLEENLSEPKPVASVDGFTGMDESALSALLSSMGLAMDLDDLKTLQAYFRDEEHRDPTVTEVRVVDTYWSDHCRHTTFSTHLDEVSIENPAVKDAYDRYLAAREEVYGLEKAAKRPQTLMDIATIGTKTLKKRGLLPELDESEEINACSIHVPAKVNGEEQDWLLMFKNETHNHPTEIEPFGGAATCIGGCIRDPLSGRAYVHQAMRVTGGGDPRKTLAETLPGKLPQRKLAQTAAAGYSSYGNQIGLATGHVAELYHEGYIAKRLECGAVVAAAPAKNVVRERPAPGDVVILLGGRTGRDGIGGATGSSKSHDMKSLTTMASEVQKGNAPEERKIQRLFRNGEVTRLIKRCNDFGAGGVSVAIGELADGLEIELDAVRKKYEGLDGTELAISESQERMAVVVAPEDEAKFIAAAQAENLEAYRVAVVTESPRMVMHWRGQTVADLSRAFLDTNGAVKHASIRVEAGKKQTESACAPCTLRDMAGSLKSASRRGLTERFDSTVGSFSLLMPFGGKTQRSPSQAMAALLPVLPGSKTEQGSVMAWGCDPDALSADPYTGAHSAVYTSVAKIVAAGAVKVARPKALIPVFPGTNCEYDTHRALLEAGADAEQFIIRNLTSADVADSVERFAKAVKDSQIIVIPGGFSGGDEPDGSAKLITAFFRNAAVKEQVTDLLEKRDGLMLGVCNGFQALIKLGLVPYGKIMDTDADFPTLTYNVIGRHQSRLVRTRVCSNKSPWLAGTKVGDIYTVPISHGEGRFLASEELVKKLAENGQIATQYVDLDGYATMDAAFNPNGSICAIEGITSPDGRVFGKMGHTERIGKELYRNVPGQYEMELFTSAVRYFK